MLPAEGFCPIHPDEPYEYFCESVDCFKQYCKLCFIIHRCSSDHILTRVDKFDESLIKQKHWELFKQNQALMQNYRILSSILNASLKEVNQREIVLPIECQKTQKYYPDDYNVLYEKMKQTADELRAFINNLCDKLETNLEFMKSISMKTMSLSQDNNKSDTIKMNFEEALLQYKQMLLDHTTASQKLQEVKMIIEREQKSGIQLKVDPLLIYPEEVKNKYEVAHELLLEPKSIPYRVKIGDATRNSLQFQFAKDFCIAARDEILIADKLNHKIQRYDKKGFLISQFGEFGTEFGNLNYPVKVASFLQTEDVIVGDTINEKSRLQIFTKDGFFIRSVNMADVQCVTCLIILPYYEEIAVLDSTKAIISIYAKLGVMIRILKCLDYIREPSGMAFFANNFYICDKMTHRIIVVDLEGEIQRIIGNDETILYPNGIDVSSTGQIVVGYPWRNNLVFTVFSNQGFFICKFDCVSLDKQTCYGVKLTSEGEIVTLSRKNCFILDPRFPSKTTN